MSGTDRDLVAALRAELAAVDPSRPCDRRAEIAGLGPVVVTREATGRAARGPPRRPCGRGRPPRRTRRPFLLPDEPLDWDRAAEHCRLAWLRGRFLARGSLSLAGGRAHLEFVVPVPDAPVARRPPRGRRPPGVVARPARAGRRDLEEHGVDRGVPRPDRGQRLAAGARGAERRAHDARRPQPRPQRRVREPPAVRGRPRVASWRRSTRWRRTGAWPSSRGRSGPWPRPGGRPPRRRCPRSRCGSTCTARPCSGPSTAWSGWPCTTTGGSAAAGTGHPAPGRGVPGRRGPGRAAAAGAGRPGVRARLA